MPRTSNFRKYHDGLKDMMDAVAQGGAPIRIPFPSGRIAAGKRSQFYAMTKALEAYGKELDEPHLKEVARKRLEGWYKVTMKVVSPGEETSSKDIVWDEPAELLLIHQNQTKEALEMAALVRTSLGNKAQGQEGMGTGLATDRTMEVLTGGLSIADMVKPVEEKTNASVTKIVSVDAVTGNQLTEDGRVLNRYGVFVGYAEGNGV